ncbi:MAG: glycosyltransferase [Flavobacteriales bacterium]|nr:glycosyltransferase [Flavobacteriales bacterium]
MEKLLFLVVSDSPYSYSGDEFLRTELTYLSDVYQQFIIVHNNSKPIPDKEVPENTKEIYFPYQLGQFEKIFALMQVFTPLFWDELSNIKKNKRLTISIGMIKTLLISLYNSKKFASHIKMLYDLYKKDNDVHIYSYWCNDMALGTAMFHKENPEAICFAKGHGSDIYHEATALKYLPCRSFLANNLTALFAISEYGKTYMESDWGNVSEANIRLAKLGIKNQLPFKERVRKGVVKMMSCSNVIPLKRVDLIIRALCLIDDIEIEWTHVGIGPLKEDMEELAANLLQNGKIRFNFKGKIGNAEVFDLYSSEQPDIFINVSTTEGIPVSIMEAMSFGIPCIATKVGGTSEIVNDTNGYLIPADPSPKEVADKIKEVIADGGKKSKSAYATWNEQYNADNNFAELVKYLKAS